MTSVQVANKRCGVDVDKFDYLARDGRCCGVAVPLDTQRLMMFSRLDRERQQVCALLLCYVGLVLGLVLCSMRIFTCAAAGASAGLCVTCVLCSMCIFTCAAGALVRCSTVPQSGAGVGLMMHTVCY
jgi:hypothetical protein